MTKYKLNEIGQAILSVAPIIPYEKYFPAKRPEATKLIVTDPYAFLVGCCLDRGTKAEIIWIIPYLMKKILGHLDPKKIHLMPLERLSDIFASLEYRPRYINDAPRTVRDLTQIVVDECGGDASQIWMEKSAEEVKSTLLAIHGVGPGIANMTLILIEKAFLYRFSDLDRTKMDIKPDVHTRRVLFRVGASDSESDESAIGATRLMNPEFPGELDGPLWWIGRNWCHASTPDCANCPISGVCAIPKRSAK